MCQNKKSKLVTGIIHTILHNIVAWQNLLRKEQQQEPNEPTLCQIQNMQTVKANEEQREALKGNVAVKDIENREETRAR